jgi:hypothetical protein
MFSIVSILASFPTAGQGGPGKPSVNASPVPDPAQRRCNPAEPREPQISPRVSRPLVVAGSPVDPEPRIGPGTNLAPKQTGDRVSTRLSRGAHGERHCLRRGTVRQVTGASALAGRDPPRAGPGGVMSVALIAMVHEMRNALVPVLTDLRAIRAAGVGHDRMERLDRIEAAVMRALNYIDQVMRASDALRPAQRDIPGSR